ncbi:uncharacterized protein LOC130783098 [Actinidia eriantha]|uniref:uncharacterized protein LOC130783098 n=1 Tax=Actinidia eriantha TaxID=165200 RepID=UPI0025838009|nr:uncharacterized protein LOC130783098 [Actinidia eriantha]
MARPIVLVFLLLVVAFASQFEWEEQSGNEVEEILSISQKQRHNSKREESVKEKIILSQEKRIQKLNELVHSLREQLLQCKDKIKAVNDTAIPLTKLLDERE